MHVSQAAGAAMLRGKSVYFIFSFGLRGNARDAKLPVGCVITHESVEE